MTWLCTMKNRLQLSCPYSGIKIMKFESNTLQLMNPIFPYSYNVSMASKFDYMVLPLQGKGQFHRKCSLSKNHKNGNNSRNIYVLPHKASIKQKSSKNSFIWVAWIRWQSNRGIYRLIGHFLAIRSQNEGTAWLYRKGRLKRKCSVHRSDNIGNIALTA